MIADVEKKMEAVKSDQSALQVKGDWDPAYVQELYLMKGRTDKDLMVGVFLNDKRSQVGLDLNSRIVPALFFQLHFKYIDYQAAVNSKGRAALLSKQYDQIHRSPIFRNFKYIKTFTPMRRMTTSYGGAIKFMLNSSKENLENGKFSVVADVVFDQIANRSYMVDPEDRLFKDSRLVRFEDGKLNPKATFTALAEFLDLPYTESMTYCSELGVRDVSSYEGNVIGFDSATVYRTYDEFANDAERTLIEYFCRDTYRQYGYDFKYYDGGEMDEKRMEELLQNCTVLDGFIRKMMRPPYMDDEREKHPDYSEEELSASVEKRLDEALEITHRGRREVAKTLMEGIDYVNRKGQPLRFMTKLEPDPALLEQPLYH